MLLDRGGSSRRAAGLHPSLKNIRQKISPNGQTRLKFGFSYEISQHNHLRYFRHHFCSTFPRNPTKPTYRFFPMTPLTRWRFQHTCRWIWRFRGCLRHNPEGKKPNNWLQETWWYIRLSQSVFVNLTMHLKQKTEEIWSWLFFTTWFSWILNFITKFNNACTSTLAILATLDSNLVANLGLRKQQPFVYLQSAPVQLARVGWADEQSRVGVWRCTAVVGGYLSWTTKVVADLKHWNVKILKHEKSGKPINIQVDLLFYGKVNIAAVIDSGYKLLLKKHNNPVNKNGNFM